MLGSLFLAIDTRYNLATNFLQESYLFDAIFSILVRTNRLHDRMKCSSKCCAACQCNGLGHDIQRPDQINFAIIFISPSFTIAFF